MRFHFDARLLLLLVFSAIAVGCSSQPSNFSRRTFTYRPLMVPEPLPPSDSDDPAITTASWYGPRFNGHRTAGGEIYRQERMTAASTLAPLGSTAEVTNLDNGRSVRVRINDCGPYVRG